MKWICTASMIIDLQHESILLNQNLQYTHFAQVISKRFPLRLISASWPKPWASQSNLNSFHAILQFSIDCFAACAAKLITFSLIILSEAVWYISTFLMNKQIRIQCIIKTCHSVTNVSLKNSPNWYFVWNVENNPCIPTNED